MAVMQRPYYTLSANALAEWIESQPQMWWVVDGDPLLTSQVDFPCPSDELAPAIREIGKKLFVQDKDLQSRATGEEVGSKQLDSLADISNRHRQKALSLSWSDSDIEWLLIEDKASAGG